MSVRSIDAVSFSRVNRSDDGFPNLGQDELGEGVVSFLREVLREVSLELVLRPHVPFYL